MVRASSLHSAPISHSDLPHRFKEADRTLERYIRLIAGIFVLESRALGTWISPYWYLFTAFVGVNLFQSPLTKWCLMEDILRELSVGK